MNARRSTPISTSGSCAAAVVVNKQHAAAAASDGEAAGPAAANEVLPTHALLPPHTAAAHLSGLMTPSDFVRATSTAAAQTFNIYPRKGRIAAGSDADVIVLDPSVTHTISAATHHSLIDTNVYEGEETFSRQLQTLQVTHHPGSYMYV
jgi:dihydroorotase-like cyclic amidohydrolase